MTEIQLLEIIATNTFWVAVGVSFFVGVSLFRFVSLRSSF